MFSERLGVSSTLLLLLVLEGRLDDHGFSGLRLRTARERDATRSHTAMRGNCTTEVEPVLPDCCMLVQPEKSLDLLVGVRQEGLDDGVNGDHAPAGITPRRRRGPGAGLIDAWASSRHWSAPSKVPSSLTVFRSTPGSYPSDVPMRRCSRGVQLCMGLEARRVLGGLQSGDRQRRSWSVYVARVVAILGSPWRALRWVLRQVRLRG